MKKLLFLVAAAVAFAADASAYVPLANTVRKLKSDKALKVAVIGDSIAYGQMASAVSMQGYPFSTRVTVNSGGMPTGNPMSFARITTDYVKYLAKRDYGVDDANINTFYSVWGGATAKSSFGYVTDDIIARQPDLVFYEIWNDNDESLRYAENTLRVLWKTLPNTDVVLISVGGAFSKSSVYQPLVEKYGIKWINAYGDVQTWFGQFGVFNSNTYGVVDADGKVSGTRGYLFGNSSPHVNEEGYVWFCDRIADSLDTVFASAASASGASEAVAPTGSVDGNPIAATGDEMYHAEIITPASLTQASGSWTLTAKEVADEPRDTCDRANGDTIKAGAADATLTRTVTGSFLIFRGSKSMQYKVGDGAFAAVSDGLVVKLSDGDVDATVTLTLKATAKDATINEFYVYGRTYQAITPKATKHRYSVKFYAKIAPEYYHDWHIGGVQVIPHPISWVNCYRMETYGAALTLPGESIISSQCERNGAFLGWVEADGVEWNGSEVIPFVTTHEGKTIYAAGGTIDPKTLGRDVTLVAAYANGPVAKAEANVRKVTFVSENSANMKLLKFVPMYESAMSVTMPDLIPPVAGSTANGWKVINTDTVYPVGAVVPITTDTEFIPVYTKTVAIDDTLLANCWTFDGTYMTDGTGWKLKATVVGGQLKITAVTAQPADSSVKLDLGRFAVNSAHDTLYLGYLIERDVFKNKTMTCAVDLGYVTKIGQGAFGASGITDVRFGPYLEEIASGWANGAFAGCASLTNAAFAQGGSATVTPGEAFTFENCTALKSLDCSGVGYLKTRANNYSQIGGCSALKDVIIRAPTKIDQGFFGGASSATYHFYGAAPELTSGALNLGSSSTTYVHLDPAAADYAAQLASWNALTQGGAINDKDSTWKTTVVSGSRPLLLYGVTPPPEEPPVEPPEEEDPEQPGEDPPPDDPPVVVGKWVLSADGTAITDGTWTFKVSASGSSYTVGECTGYPDVVSELDFTKPLVDQAGVAKQFKGFENCFGTGKDNFRSPACERVGDLKLAPKNIGNNTFGGCANLRLVGGFPAEITSVGMHAFQRSGLGGDLDLTHITSFQRAAFMQTAITSVRLGSGITTFADAYGTGVFQGCTSLTNVVFDPSGSISLSDGEGWTFNGCSALKSVDLSGVSVLKCDNSDDRAMFKGCSALKTVIISNLTSMTTHVFSGAGAADYHFYGAAPSISAGTKLGAVGGTTYVHLDQGSRNYNAMLLGWGALTEGGVLNEADSTWNSGVVNDGAKRPLLLVKYGTAPGTDPEEPPEDGPADHWTYNGETITDGDWTFAATVKAGTTEMTVGAVSGWPTELATLDFSKPVKDDSASYVIVKLDTRFVQDPSCDLDVSNFDYFNIASTKKVEGANYLQKLILPPTGLKAIWKGAFGWCTKLTEVVNFVPDSVEIVGQGAFLGVPAQQDVRLYGIRVAYFSVFRSSGITGVTFGPGLKELQSAYGVSSFDGCKQLAFVKFDPEMEGCGFSGSSYGPFNGCSKISGTLDLRGFKTFNLGSAFSGAQSEKVIVGANCTTLYVETFQNMTKLTEIEFLGKPPVFYSGGSVTDEPKLNFGRTAVVTTTVHQAYIEEPNSRGQTWLDFAAKKRIWNAKTTWNASFVYDGVTVENRPLIAPDGIDPIEEEEKVINYDGTSWVFDVENETLGDGKWLFAVLADGANLKVGSCLKWPSELSKLDFSMAATNEAGEAYTITELNTAFGPSNTSTSDAGLKVGELVLNDGLVSIGAAAFSRLDNCTNVVNFLPDTVTKIGNYAFYKFPVRADLKVLGLPNMGTKNADGYTQQFGSSKVTSVTFGPGFKSMFSWDNGPFKGCTSLTNVTFDAAMTGGFFGGIRSDGFCGCSALAGTVDLSGFSSLAYVSDYGGGNNIFTGTKVERFIVSEQCTKLAAGFFDGDTSLKEVVFTGPPPTIETNKNESTGWNAKKASRLYNYSQSSLKITTYITKANREAWAPYVLYKGQPVDKVPPGKGVTWKPEYVTAGIDLSLRPVKILDMAPGLMLIVK